MLGVKTHCYNITFSLKTIKDLHKETVENEEGKTLKSFVAKEQQKPVCSRRQLAGLRRM